MVEDANAQIWRGLGTHPKLKQRLGQIHLPHLVAALGIIGKITHYLEKETD